MIIKYKEKNVWGFIDNVSQVAYKDIIVHELTEQYDKECKTGDRIDVSGDGAYNEDVVLSNKLFLMASESINCDLDDKNVRTVNLINETLISNPTCIVVLYLENAKEFDCIVLISNQSIYLMNNEGKTIERVN